MLYRSSIREARRNPEMNPHIGAWDYVEKYKNDPDVYISFTEIDKIGINPQSKYNTPVGIYTYPLKEFVERYIFGSISAVDEYNKLYVKVTVGSFAPFAGEAKYINFIRLKDKAHFINDMYKDYGSNDYDRDIKILEKKYSELLFQQWNSRMLSMPIYVSEETPKEVWLGFIEYCINNARVKNSVGSIWNITRELAEILSDNEKQASTKWNLILSKDLEYSGFADKSGKGYIHPSEPMQAVFFNTRAFEVIARVENIPAKRTADGVIYKKGDTFKDTKNGIIYTIKKIIMSFSYEIEYVVATSEGKGFFYKQSYIQKLLNQGDWKKI